MNNFLGNDEGKNDYISINLPFINKIILRNKYLFASFVVIFTIIGWAYSLSKKPLYKGQFEIVIDQNKNKINNPSLSVPFFNNFNADMSLSSLETELGILESPSVLRPVYEYVMSEKSKTNPEFNDLSFNSWKENFFKINLKEQTSILRIIYRDNDKTLIKPVLDKISETYQIYSGKTKRRELELSKDYLSSQIVNFKAKSNKSLNRVQEYAIDNNLSNELLTSSGFENSRKVIKDKIRNIDLQIEKITNIGESYNNLQYVGFITPSEEHKSLMQKLTSLEEELLTLQYKYKPSDINIELKKKEKELTTNLLKDKTIGFLETEKFILQTKLESISRPKEVILTFKQILRDSARQEKLLTKLEDQLQLTNLEAAKLEDPWELITEPYVDSEPITKNIQFILLGIFVGSILGTSASILKEKNKGIVFDPEVLEQKFDCRIIETVKVSNQESIKVFNALLKNILSLFKNDKIKFLVIGEESSLILNFKKLITFNETKIEIEKDLSNVLDAKKLFILSSLNLVEEKKLNYIASKIKFLNIDTEGIIMVEE
tara:strand:+ start:1494 stop:3131 length:1638 start_codon:yes stop_codon:yes gene_type:complete